MLVVRPGGPADIDELLDLAFLSGRGFTSLPENRATLAERLDLSQRSFAGTVAPEQAWYVLMLEDSETGTVEGVAAVKGAVGLARPHYAFRVVTLAQFSPATEVRFDHQMLVLANECTGYSEVGSLFLRPGKRQGGAGSLLARSRYMLIAGHRDRFAKTVMAELRGWFDEQDNSPFWDGIAGKFFRIPFEQADQMITSTDGQCILDLAPRHPIYLELVDPAARGVIGTVHRHGEAALAMLEREGFARSGLIDIFDGGPTVTCPRDAIATVREAEVKAVKVATALPEGTSEHLLATTGLGSGGVVCHAGGVRRAHGFPRQGAEERGRGAGCTGRLGGMEERLQSQPLRRVLGGHAFRRPASHLVVLRQHLVEAIHQPLGRAGLGRLVQQPRRQGVVLGGEAGAVVEVALHVPHALADQGQVFQRELVATGGGHLRLQVGQAPGEGGEHAADRHAGVPGDLPVFGRVGAGTVGVLLAEVVPAVLGEHDDRPAGLGIDQHGGDPVHRAHGLDRGRTGQARQHQAEEKSGFAHHEAPGGGKKGIRSCGSKDARTSPGVQ